MVRAQWLQQTAGVEDRRVPEAVRWHVTGGKGRGPAAKFIFLADKLDPEKLERHPYLEEIRALARDSLDKALMEFLVRELAYRLHKGDLVHPGSLQLRNELEVTLS